jgi:hypothetical protein
MLKAPRRPNDPSAMASVETALSSAMRPGILGLIWNWRYELGCSAGLATVGLARLVRRSGAPRAVRIKMKGLRTVSPPRSLARSRRG